MILNMERVLDQDERIRRAEEIYAKRRNLRERRARATVTVAEPKNFKLFKKLILQIAICILIYFILHLINTTNYSFSKDTLSKTEELISHDFDFYSIYSNAVEVINNYLYSDGIIPGNNETNGDGEETEDQNQIPANVEQNENSENIGTDGEQSEEEGVNQSEVSYTEGSETERVKNTYSFVSPVVRNCFIRIWRKRGYSRCSNSIS